MSRGSARNGPVAKLLAIVLTALGTLAMFMVVAWLSTRISTSESTEQIFNDAAELPDEMIDAVTWLPDTPGLSRQMEPLTRLDITDAWLRAWAQFTLVAGTGDTTGLDVTFSSSALQAIEASAGDMVGLPIQQIGHDLRLDFYSEDGQIVGVEATNTRLLRSIASGDNTPAWYDSAESYEAILVLEDGNWRVHHWIRTGIRGAWWTEPAAPALGSAPTTVHGINYYPRDYPWTDFWGSFEPSVTEADLDRIQGIGLNTVRIFVPFAEMNGRHVAAGDLAPVVDFLDQAQARQIDVIVTLFDGRTDHRPARWDADEAHLEGIVDVLAGHPSIVAWDLKNEPDRDIGIHGLTDDLLYAWLGHLARHLRALDPVTPITIGWSTGDAAAVAPHHGDIVSFHHYGPADELPAIVAELRTVAAHRPIWLTEYGLPTWNTLWPNGHTEDEQAAYYADVLGHADELGLEGRLAWTLWDLLTAPPDAGRLPWRTGPQTNLGVLRADGEPKPAAAVLAPGVDVRSVPRPGMVATTARKPFRMALLSVGFVGVLSVVGQIFLLRLQRHRADDRLLVSARSLSHAPGARPVGPRAEDVNENRVRNGVPAGAQQPE